MSQKLNNQLGDDYIIIINSGFFRSVAVYKNPFLYLQNLILDVVAMILSILMALVSARKVAATNM